MPITIGYTPFPAVAQMALAQGQYQGGLQREQMDQQWARMQQADDQQRRSIAASMYQQQQNLMANAAHDAQRMALAQQGQQWQQQYQAEALRQQDLRNRFGLYAKEMGDITDLEAKGFRYSPEQDMRIKRLDADIEAARNDEYLTPVQKQEAENQYLQKRSMIRPQAPPPKPASDVLAENWVSRTLADGTVVEGVLGNRNGAVTFDPVESPKVKEDQHNAKMEMEQHKLEAARSLNQEKLNNAILKAQFDQVKWQQESQQRQIDQEENHRFQRTNQFNTAYMKHLADIGKLMQGVKDPNDPMGRTVVPQATIDAREAGFRKLWGPIAREVAPQLADEWGIAGDAQAPQQQGQPQQQPQAQQAAPQQVDMGRIAKAKAAAEAALHSAQTTAAEKADAQELLNQLKQQGF